MSHSLFDTVDRRDGMIAVLDYLNVDWRGRSGWQKIRCPYTMNHANGDRNPSGSVNLDEGAYTCHACGASGDWARLIYDIAGIKVNDAVRVLGLEVNGEAGAGHDPTEGGLFLY